MVTEVTLDASDDCTVDRNAPDTNRDTVGYLATGSANGGAPRYASYLKFDLSSLAGKTIDTAVLKLYCYASLYTDDVMYGRKVSDDSWTEEAITWNTKKAVGANVFSVNCGESVGWHEYDVKSYVDEEKGGDMSICLELDEGDGVGDYNFYRDKEYNGGSNKPVLIVNYSEVGLASRRLLVGVGT